MKLALPRHAASSLDITIALKGSFSSSAASTLDIALVPSPSHNILDDSSTILHTHYYYASVVTANDTIATTCISFT